MTWGGRRCGDFALGSFLLASARWSGMDMLTTGLQSHPAPTAMQLRTPWGKGSVRRLPHLIQGRRAANAAETRKSDGWKRSGVKLAEGKGRLKAIEGMLGDKPFVEFHAFERQGRTLHVALTDQLRKHARKQGVWGSREMFATLKNASYGFDERQARSAGGRDGIFLVDPAYRPTNEMIRKLFSGFLEHPGGYAEQVVAALGTSVEKLLPVRLVSHHLRLLGVLARKEDADWLVLVDCDRSRVGEKQPALREDLIGAGQQDADLWWPVSARRSDRMATRFQPRCTMRYGLFAGCGRKWV